MTTHVEDGALVRLLDGENADGERAEVETHLSDCGRCAARLQELSRAAAALTDALRAADAPAPRARPAPRWGLRAAAALLVLAGVGGAVRPVRAWIIQRAEALWDAVAGRNGSAIRPGAPGVAPLASVAFAPSGDELTVEVTGHQGGGVLRIETVEGDTVAAIVRDGSGVEDLVVLPSGLRIVTGPTSRATYVIRIPAQLARVRVLVGEQAPLDYRPGGPAIEIALGGR
jgi:anti-sigma factor RsiW